MAYGALPLVLALATVLAAVNRSSAGEFPENLQCYKVKEDTSKLSYIADLGGLGPQPDCKILTPPILACLPTVAINVAPTPPGPPAGIPVAWAATVLCYKTKCKKGLRTEVLIADQFGTHTLAPTLSKLFCVPTHRPQCDDVSCGPFEECRVLEPTQEPYCADSCDAYPCPAGQTCQLEPVVCPALPCPPIARCVDPCDGVSCGPWQVCRVHEATKRAYCADSCDVFPCPTGMTCELEPVVCPASPCPPVARCVVDPCSGEGCAPWQECRVYEPTQEPYCADTCNGFPCRSGQTCQLQQPACVVGPCPPIARCIDSCNGLGCAPWQECRMHAPTQAAYCADTCDGFVCPSGHTCELQQPVCLTEPCPPIARCVETCNSLSCAPFQECRVYAPTQEPYCADTCDGFPCPSGQACELRPRPCVEGPCPPAAICVDARCGDVVCAGPSSECRVWEPTGSEYCAETCDGFQCKGGYACELRCRYDAQPCVPYRVCVPPPAPLP